MDLYGSNGCLAGVFLQESSSNSWQVSGGCAQCHCFFGLFEVLFIFLSVEVSCHV